ncbi:hypothetical protein RHSIM_RhsimUnG0173400 [Rhododendron simsii]|uniref:Zinc finger PMZ-type domain-containing protein n=1 Tax=Rhododendron simsii TaxID=118357 RepID=A0A834FTV7_RHOSS|nr:hypothetical protein RHSIM_RhsimUnG0173400 [Rhododendron simsii]
MDDNVQRNGKHVVIDICDDSSNDDGNDDKRLDELTEEEVYQMTFDMHEDGETFYNAYAKTVETYTWVLERFLDSMDHKKPVSVMTDGDKAMRRVIKTVLPDVNHPYSEKCMSMSTEEEFEVAWKNLLDDYSLHQNQWAVDIYKKKTLWVEAYLALAKLRHNEAKPDATWSVNFQPNDGIMKCSYLKFESIGFPCQHMISIMKMEHMREIPSCLILQRWTKMAKSFPLHGSTPMPEWVTQTTRFRALSSACVEMCYYASHITKGYNETKEEITKLTSRMRELYVLHVEEEQRNMRQNDNVEGTSMHFGVGDPIIIKGKGTHNLAKDFIPKTRKCGNCREPNHIRTKCPKLMHGDNVGNMNEDEDT